MQTQNNNTTPFINLKNVDYHTLLPGVYPLEITDDDIVNGRHHFLISSSLNGLINQSTLSVCNIFLNHVSPALLLHIAQKLFMNNFLMEDEDLYEPEYKEQVAILAQFLSELNVLEKNILQDELSDYVRH